MRPLAAGCCLIWCCAAAVAWAQGQPRWEFQDGDRVVWLGGGLIERAQRHGWLEAALTAAHPDRRIAFRNQGWSGDTVRAEARAYFGTPADGFKHLLEHVQQASPTVIILGYGANESFAGPPGLRAFEQDYQTLLDALKPTGARIVMLTPIPLFNLGPPLPDPAPANRNLEVYSRAVVDLAARNGHRAVDLFSAFSAVSPAEHRLLTDDGVLLNAAGYRLMALELSRLLGLSDKPWSLRVDLASRRIEASGATIEPGRFNDDQVRLALRDDRLPIESVRTVVVQGLPAGEHELKIDGVPVARAGAEQWAAGVAIRSGPPFDQAEFLRRAIVEKDELFFHGYRPQNETYLRGFRKHEQGNNAVEIPRFQPLVDSKEQAVRALNSPARHVYEWTPIRPGDAR